MSEAARARLAEGFALRRRHDTEGAYAAIAEAAAIDPSDGEAALALAHIAYETWRPAADLFAKAQALNRENAAIASAHARALNAEGQRATAEALLETVLRRHPGSIDAQRTLATIRATAGDPDWDRGYAEGCGTLPDDRALRLAWFHALAATRRWDDARHVLAWGASRWGPVATIRLGMAFMASESDEGSRDPAIFDPVADIDDPGLDLAGVRFWLRVGEPAKAAEIARARVAGPAARMFWPYLSLAWRLTGDPRADGLDVGVTTVDLDAEGLDEIDVTLRRLLVLEAPFHEQSVRGGIQTDRHLFFNPDPVIQRFRKRFAQAVSAYIAALPPPDPGHPLLGAPRDRAIRFEGSWGVLLRGSGFHAPHTHVRGWISSAFYLSLPEMAGEQGALAFGAPPPELGLELAPRRIVEPAPGRLVLFPSTMWHGTLPFAQGERLTIAFDVAVPD